MNTRFQAKGSTAEIWLYDQIGASFWGDGISAKAFQKELTALGKVSTINLRINSPGGDVFDGLAIYNQLKSHPARVVVDIDGLAASIASIIAMAGDEIRMASNAMMMIHNPHGMAVGDATEMQRVAALLGQVKGSLTGTYAARTGKDVDDLGAMMTAETWLSADDAVAMRFADNITEMQRLAAHFDFSKFRNVPKRLTVRDNAPATPARDIAAVRLAANEQKLAGRVPA
jgi:ATP-dependent Clp endopeptidase proteolytic subunit ClpP